ncbi:PRD domain-containing protein [Anaerobacillus alkaliphilus]|uniref:PRD domain-containing protein n=1 Tax=Anaerobacillus alkaliphilus TaxID=1548597 RepID=A0A4V1LGK6_9BACI|nr:PRD domain-containing protein [Anaerobacillus alkaliphilus]RXJ02052.1 PRD domain-containing protein [Anaerobacillus alkaliphilus]
MKIKKVLNNNTVVVEEDGIERICMGSGIGFNKRKGDVILRSDAEKIFVMADENERFQELLKTLPVSHVEVAEEIISYAERTLNVPLNTHIHIALTDHLSFAIERLQKGLVIENKLLNEIKTLYRKEYEIGLWAKELIQERLNVTIPDDEIGYIAIHIHTAKEQTNSMESTMKQAAIVKEMIEIIESHLNSSVSYESVSYQRLIAHIRFALQALETGDPLHTLDAEMHELIKTKYSDSYRCAIKIKNHLKEEYDLVFPESELAYISLHIQNMFNAK